jgi:serine/threonine protein kinase
MIPTLGDWRYTLEERLGGGGYAQAYRCHRVSLPAEAYSIKVFANPLYANTFESEVRALQAMTGCPGTPALIDYGRNEQGKLCLVTAFAPGERLDRHIRSQGPISPQQTSELIAQTLAVLSHAHSRGLLHKDVKASNILVSGNRFTLLDWGVAEPVGSGRSESIRAKQDYVAPECYYGDHHFATDFYSLGWLAVEALTGALPYHFQEIRDADYRVAAHCLERPRLPPGIPAALRNLILNWLDKRPAHRLVGYDLTEVQSEARGYAADFSADMDVRQIKHECSYLHQAARHGIPYAQYHFALRLLALQRRPEARYWLQAARDNGYLQATCQLAQLLGQGREQEKTRGRELLAEAAQAGHTLAQYLLGLSLLSGKGPRRDVDRACTLLRLAAAAGHARSQNEIGRLLANELGRPDEAELYFAMAAERSRSPGSRKV